MLGRWLEGVETLTRRRVDVCCVQEVQYKGEKAVEFLEMEKRYISFGGQGRRRTREAT